MFERNTDVGKADQLATVLANFFTEVEVGSIIAAGKEQVWKNALTENTKRALDLGAFGAPWFWVRNSRGVQEPFFGSDRFVSVYVPDARSLLTSSLALHVGFSGHSASGL